MHEGGEFQYMVGITCAGIAIIVLLIAVVCAWSSLDQHLRINKLEAEIRSLKKQKNGKESDQTKTNTEAT